MSSIPTTKTLDDLRVADARFVKLFKDLKSLHENHSLGSQGVVHSVIGETCSGRSYMANALVLRIPTTRDEEGFTRPVANVLMPNGGNPKLVILAALTGLGVVGSMGFAPTQLKNTLRTQVREQNTKTLVFDRADRAGAPQFEIMSEIVEELGLTVILLGGSKLPGSFDAAGAPTSIVGQTLFLEPYRWPADAKDFTDALAAADDQMPSGELSGFDDMGSLMPLRFHAASAGLFPRSMKLIKDAARIAYADGRKIVTKTDLATVYRTVFRQPDTNNPFLLNDMTKFKAKAPKADSSDKPANGTRLQGRDPKTVSHFQ